MKAVRVKGEEGGFVPAEDNDEDVGDDDGCMDNDDNDECEDEDVTEDVPERERNGDENCGQNSKRILPRSQSKAMNRWNMAISASLEAFLQVSEIEVRLFFYSIPSFRQFKGSFSS